MAAILGAGEEVRVAGGAVRNALLDFPINDVDLATTMLPDEVMRVGKAAGFGVHPTGIEHGTITVVNRGRPFEVTTLRRDIETDGRRAVVSFTRDFAEDAQRRDFTINALYCDQDGNIFDYTTGLLDIARKRVRFVGDSAARIREDYLRILRFFRFSAWYGKGPLCPVGLAACKQLKDGLKQISAERMRQETLKILVAPRAVVILQAMAKAQILELVFPHTDEFEVVDRLPEDAILRLVALAKDPPALKESLRLSNAEAERIDDILRMTPLSPLLTVQQRHALIYKFGPQAFTDVTWLSQARSKAKMNDAGWQGLKDLARDWPVPVLPVSGQDLVANGIKPGSGLGQRLKAIEDYWIAQDFKPTRTELLGRIGAGNENGK